MKRAFSLIELIVTIAIIGILAAISVPLYTQYKARVIVTTAYSDLSKFAEQIIKFHELKGRVPGYDEITFQGVPMAWAFRVVNYEDVYQLGYERASDDNGFFLAATVQGLSGLVPNYIEPQDSFGHASVIRYGVRNIDGVWRIVCGTSNIAAITPPSGMDVPFEYQPSNCNCTSVHDFAYGTDYSCLNN